MKGLIIKNVADKTSKTDIAILPDFNMALLKGAYIETAVKLPKNEK
jgi:hypothetical protein